MRTRLKHRDGEVVHLARFMILADGYYVQAADGRRLGCVAPEVYNLIGLISDFGTNPRLPSSGKMVSKAITPITVAVGSENGVERNITEKGS